jgi:hypothetical protein
MDTMENFIYHYSPFPDIWNRETLPLIEEDFELMPNPDPTQDTVDLSSAKPEKELTILFYMNGQFEDIGDVIAQSMFNLEAVGSDENMNIVAKLGRIPKIRQDGRRIPIDGDWSGVRTFEIGTHEHKHKAALLEKMIELEYKYPENPMLKYFIARDLWESGDKKAANEYFDKARKLNINDYLNNMKSEKSQAMLKECNEASDAAFEIANNEGKAYESKIIEDLGQDARMDDPQQLQNLIQLGMEKYPAKHYVVVINSHGGGWTGVAGLEPFEIEEAIKNGVLEANKKTGRNDHIDVLDLNSCYMGNIEALAQFRNLADFTIASENKSKVSSSLDWERHLRVVEQDLKEGKEFDARKFVNDKVNFYKQENIDIKKYLSDLSQVPVLQKFPTLVAVENAKLETLTDAWKTFNDICEKNNVTDKQFFTAVKNAKNYPSQAYNPLEIASQYGDFRDMGGIVKNIKNIDGISEQVKASAEDVLKALNSAIVNEQHEGNRMEGSNGISIWAPTNYADLKSSIGIYQEYVPYFSTQSGWILKLAETARRIPIEIRNKFNNKFSEINDIYSKLDDVNITEEQRCALEQKLDEQMAKLVEIKQSCDFTMIA